MTGDRRKQQTVKSFIIKYQGGNTNIRSNQRTLTTAQHTVSVSHTVRFKILTALLLKIQVFQNITLSLFPMTQLHILGRPEPSTSHITSNIKLTTPSPVLTRTSMA